MNQQQLTAPEKDFLKLEQLIVKPDRLFHVSENSDIKTFAPKPSPSKFDKINGDVVFAVSEKFLHNYIFPRDCPRVTWYTTTKTSESDKQKFLGQSSAEFVLAVEKKWLQAMQQTVLYFYEFRPDSFILLDECAGYYISYEPVEPVSVQRIENPLEELLKRKNIELRILPELWPLAEQMAKSSLHFSLIRMRNAVTGNIQ